jgi:hypothetical protein
MSDAVNVNVLVVTGSWVGAVASHDGVASPPYRQAERMSSPR